MKTDIKTTSSRGSNWAQFTVFMYVLIALISDLLAGGRPIYAVDLQGNSHYPVFENWLMSIGLYSPQLMPPGGIWKTLPLQYAIWPLIPYGASEVNLSHALLTPFSNGALLEKHYLGTDALGRDVLSGIIHGTKYSIGIATASMLLAAILGIMLGLVAGWWGDDRYRVRRWEAIAISGSLLLGATQIWVSPRIWSFGFALATILLQGTWWVSWLLIRKLLPSWTNKKLKIPIDQSLTSLLILISSFPAFLLVLSLSQSLGKGIGLVIVSLSALGWPLFALVVRNETQRMRRVEFIEANICLGFNDLRIHWLHLIPILVPRLQVAFSLGIAQAILVESAFSYLGLGLPLDQVSWGSLIASAQSQPDAEWLILFPGLALVGFVGALMHLSEGIDTYRF